MDQEILEELGEFYKIIGDTTRLRILELLQKDELNVSEISSKLDMTASAISHQLQVLRYHDLVKTRRNGKRAEEMAQQLRALAALPEEGRSGGGRHTDGRNPPAEDELEVNLCHRISERGGPYGMVWLEYPGCGGSK